MRPHVAFCNHTHTTWDRGLWAWDYTSTQLCTSSLTWLLPGNFNICSPPLLPCHPPLHPRSLQQSLRWALGPTTWTPWVTTPRGCPGLPRVSPTTWWPWRSTLTGPLQPSSHRRGREGCAGRCWSLQAFGSVSACRVPGCNTLVSTCAKCWPLLVSHVLPSKYVRADCACPPLPSSQEDSYSEPLV
jgi:hypothetical protein